MKQECKTNNSAFSTIEEQKRIASYLKEKMAYVEKLQSAIRNQQSAIEALPQAILKRLKANSLWQN